MCLGADAMLLSTLYSFGSGDEDLLRISHSGTQGSFQDKECDESGADSHAIALCHFRRHLTSLRPHRAWNTLCSQVVPVDDLSKLVARNAHVLLRSVTTTHPVARRRTATDDCQRTVRSVPVPSDLSAVAKKRFRARPIGVVGADETGLCSRRQNSRAVELKAIPDDLARFVRECVDRLETLDPLLLQSSERRWTVLQLKTEMRSSKMSVEQGLGILCARELVAKEGDAYLFRPKSPALEKMTRDSEEKMTRDSEDDAAPAQTGQRHSQLELGGSTRRRRDEHLFSHEGRVALAGPDALCDRLTDPRGCSVWSTVLGAHKPDPDRES